MIFYEPKYILGLYTANAFKGTVWYLVADSCKQGNVSLAVSTCLLVVDKDKVKGALTVLWMGKVTSWSPFFVSELFVLSFFSSLTIHKKSVKQNHPYDDTHKWWYGPKNKTRSQCGQRAARVSVVFNWARKEVCRSYSLYSEICFCIDPETNQNHISSWYVAALLCCLIKTAWGTKWGALCLMVCAPICTAQVNWVYIVIAFQIWIWRQGRSDYSSNSSLLLLNVLLFKKKLLTLRVQRRSRSAALTTIH